MNPDNIITSKNRAFTEITGYTRREALGKNLQLLLKSHRHRPDFYTEIDQAVAQHGRWQGELWERRKNDETFPVWKTITQVRDDNGEIIHYVSDISSIKQSQEKLDFLAFHDPLTDLPNRILFYDRFEHALRHALREKKRIALLFDHPATTIHVTLKNVTWVACLNDPPNKQI